MSKTFTLGEAQTLLPVLESLLKRAQESALEANRLAYEMQQLSQLIHLSGGMHIDVVAAARRRAQADKAAQQAKHLLAEMEEIGAMVQDLEGGYLDLPTQVEGTTAFLSWKLGEPAITHWHAEGESYTARRPLDSRFHRSDRERLN